MQNDVAKNHKQMRISYAVAISASQRPKRNSNLNPRRKDMIWTMLAAAATIQFIQTAYEQT